VFSDIVMPRGMTGYNVAEWIHSMKPEVKVLLTT
jgi:CheY-like chemotaxis protein